jgi:epoxyqueuosine reductase
MNDASQLLRVFADKNGIDAIGAVRIGITDQASQARSESESTDLRQLAAQALPSARSVVILALAYFDERRADISTLGEPHGVISRAYWKDHIAVLDALAERLAASLREGGAKAVVIRDFPLRDLAVQAGIGTLGKNSLLQSYDNGSWVLLAGLLTDLAFPAADVEGCRCGSCQACIRLCPTQAIRQPFVLDQSRCIGHILSSPDEIPRDLRGPIGKRILSCDLCQEVCPRNKFVQAAPERSPDRYGTLTRSPDLRALLKMSEDECRQFFPLPQGSDPDPFVLRRNAIIALGNSGDPSAELALSEGLHDPDSRLRGYSAWALGQLQARSAIKAIEESLLVEQDEFAKVEMALALHCLREQKE